VGACGSSRGGKKRLLQLAEAMRNAPDQLFQVAGHTAHDPVVAPVYRSVMATNWEVAALRATQVVRFLEESGKVPGAQLVVAGFADHRPEAEGESEGEPVAVGRIEISALGALPEPGVQEGESDGARPSAQPEAAPAGSPAGE
jgi:chemotaxis protein MotB